MSPLLELVAPDGLGPCRSCGFYLSILRSSSASGDVIGDVPRASVGEPTGSGRGAGAATPSAVRPGIRAATSALEGLGGRRETATIPSRDPSTRHTASIMPNPSWPLLTISRRSHGAVAPRSSDPDR